jgi:hypothetical protein
MSIELAQRVQKAIENLNIMIYAERQFLMTMKTAPNESQDQRFANYALIKKGELVLEVLLDLRKILVD